MKVKLNKKSFFVKFTRNKIPFIFPLLLSLFIIQHGQIVRGDYNTLNALNLEIKGYKKETCKLFGSIIPLRTNLNAFIEDTNNKLQEAQEKGFDTFFYVKPILDSATQKANKINEHEDKASTACSDAIEHADQAQSYFTGYATSATQPDAANRGLLEEKANVLNQKSLAESAYNSARELYDEAKTLASRADQRLTRLLNNLPADEVSIQTQNSENNIEGTPSRTNSHIRTVRDTAALPETTTPPLSVDTAEIPDPEAPAVTDTEKKLCETAKENIDDITYVFEKIKEEEDKVPEEDFESLEEDVTSSQQSITNLRSVDCTTAAPSSYAADLQTIQETREKAYETLNTVCKKYKTKAHKCCSKPSDCVFEEVFGESPGIDLQVITGTLSALSQGIASSGDKSTAGKMCEIMRTSSLAISGVNAAFGGICLVKINYCLDICDSGIENIDDLPDSDSSTDSIKKLKRNASSCKGLRVAGGMMFVQSALLGGLTAFFQYCANTAKEDPTEDNNVDDSLRNSLTNYWKNFCSSNLNHPSCSKCLKNNQVNLDSFECTNPNPTNQNAGNNNGVQADGGGSSNRRSRDNELYDGETVDPLNLEGEQRFQPIPVAENKNLSSQSLPSGGSGAGGGLGGSGGSSPQPRKNKKSKSSKDKKHNTDILEGFRSGGGSMVSVPLNQQGGKGSSGYNSKSRRSSRSKREKFNLKDFLPGFKKDPKKKEKELALLNKKKTLKVNIQRGNIFFINSKKIYQICLTHRIQDCNLKRK